MPSCPAETVPALEMPPVKLGPVIEMAVLVDVILLALSIRMPRLDARIAPLSRIEPLIVLPVI